MYSLHSVLFADYRSFNIRSLKNDCGQRWPVSSLFGKVPMYKVKDLTWVIITLNFQRLILFQRKTVVLLLAAMHTPRLGNAIAHYRVSLLNTRAAHPLGLPLSSTFSIASVHFPKSFEKNWYYEIFLSLSMSLGLEMRFFQSIGVFQFIREREDKGDL